jgi:hypothetical protein
MPEYFMSNNVAQFDLSNSSVVGSTLAGTFDPNVVDSSILLPAAISNSQCFYAGAPILVGGPSLTTKVFGRFDFWASTNAAQSINAEHFFLRIRNNIGQVVFRLDQRSTGGGAQADVVAQFWNGSTFVDIGPQVSLPLLGLNTWNFEFLPGALGSFVLYVNGATVPLLSVSGFNAAVNNCAVVDIANPTSANAHISQVALSDVDLRGAKIYSRRPSANGFYTAGTGTFTDVNTILKNDLTGIGLPVAGNRKTFLLPTVTAPGRVIRNVHVNNLCAGAGATPNARIVTRRVSTDSVSGNISPAPGVGLSARQTALPVDLSTGLAWTLANFNATEFGVEGRA